MCDDTGSSILSESHWAPAFLAPQSAAIHGRSPRRRDDEKTKRRPLAAVSFAPWRTGSIHGHRQFLGFLGVHLQLAVLDAQVDLAAVGQLAEQQLVGQCALDL